jgi:hypothetical protein
LIFLAIREASNVAITKRYDTPLRFRLETLSVALEEAVVPCNVAGVKVAFGELLKLIVTGDPTGTWLACTTTAMGSTSEFGNRRSMVVKLDPDCAGTL